MNWLKAWFKSLNIHQPDLTEEEKTQVKEWLMMNDDYICRARRFLWSRGFDVYVEIEHDFYEDGESETYLFDFFRIGEKSKWDNWR